MYWENQRNLQFTLVRMTIEIYKLAGIDVDFPREKPMTHYRPDIDGLRTLAVMPVLLYHANIPGFTGGFVGVDVFFVISGFLITALLLKDLAAEKFSLISFYERRARRILPALVAVIVFSVAVSWWIGIPSVIDGVARSAIAITLCSSNIFFKREFGYFDSGAITKPLLHTWSLSVEEQFYIIFPVVLYFGWKYARKYLGIGLFALTAFSFAASVSAVGRKPTAAFYLLQFRAWEVGLGCLLALALHPDVNFRLPKLPHRAREILSVLGCAGIVVPIALYSEQTRFPGLAALPPCLGAFLLIWTNTAGQTLVGRVLSTKVAVGIGLLSYSLYLWHWPLLVFAPLHHGEPLNAWQGLAILGCSLVAAWLSVEFIEKPFREKRLLAKRKHILATSALVLVVIGAGSLTLSKLNLLHVGQAKTGLQADARRNNLNFAHQTWNLYDGVSVYSTGDLDQPGILLLGDSFAQHWTNGLVTWAQEHQIPVHIQAIASGLPLIDVYRPFYETEQKTDYRLRNESFGLLLDRLKIKHVVLAAAWNPYLKPEMPPQFQISDGSKYPQTIAEQRALIEQQLDKTIHFFIARGCKVWLMLPPPNYSFSVPTKLAALARRQAPLSDSFISLEVAEQRRQPSCDLLRAAAARYKPTQVEILDPIKHFCQNGFCITANDDRSLYIDEWHLSYDGSMLGQHVFDALAKDEGLDAAENQALAAGKKKTSKE